MDGSAKLQTLLAIIPGRSANALLSLDALPGIAPVATCGLREIGGGPKGGI